LAEPLFTAIAYLCTAWLLLGVPTSFFRLASAVNVNYRSAKELSLRVKNVRAWLDVSAHEPGETSLCSRENALGIFNLLETQTRQIKGALDTRGLHWLLGVGYLSLWSDLNDAESLLVHLEPQWRVWARAKRAMTHLASSSLSTRELVEDLQRAMDVLATPLAATTAVAGANTRSGDNALWAQQRARACVGQIQYLLGEQRTDTYSGFVRSRNVLMGTCALTSIVMYMLFWLAILVNDTWHADASQLLHCAMFMYLAGAGIGLFNLLYVQSGLDSMVDDYNLATIRLLVAPQLSGLAAVMGIVITSIGSMHAGVLSPQDIFDVSARPLNILGAAGFALSPGLVLARFRRQTEEAKRNLKRKSAGHFGP
jgi:hypothetical protein